jgi:hypothetical protein
LERLGLDKECAFALGLLHTPASFVTVRLDLQRPREGQAFPRGAVFAVDMRECRQVSHLLTTWACLMQGRF